MIDIFSFMLLYNNDKVFFFKISSYIGKISYEMTEQLLAFKIQRNTYSSNWNTPY